MRQTDSPVLGITATKLKFAAPTVSASAESWGAHSCTVQDNVTYGLSLSLFFERITHDYTRTTALLH
jgi:hypothetical protein